MNSSASRGYEEISDKVRLVSVISNGVIGIEQLMFIPMNSLTINS